MPGGIQGGMTQPGMWGSTDGLGRAWKARGSRGDATSAVFGQKAQLQKHLFPSSVVPLTVAVGGPLP